MQFDTLSYEPKNRETIMLQPTDVNKISTLHQCGWGSKKISKELGISRGTVRKYLRQGEWLPPVPRNTKKLAGLDDWLKSTFDKHRGNCAVIRQDLIKEHQITVSIRTVERSVKHLRAEKIVEAKATVRFETPPGKQLQIDFGSIKVSIGDQRVKVYLYVATLGYSRRVFVKPFTHERQSAWIQGTEGAFQHFGGIPRELLIDNARPLVTLHNPMTNTVIFNERFKSFAQYWRINVKACRPYRARTKGKDERMVGYVKRNAIAGHSFPHWEAFEQHLANWMTQVADHRVHGTTGELPIHRFLREEKEALNPMDKPSFAQVREVRRRVQTDATIEVDTNHYSVPVKYIGEQLLVEISDGKLTIFHQENVIAEHRTSTGRKERHMKPEHLSEVIKFSCADKEEEVLGRNSDLYRPLAEYEQVVGGGW